MPYPPEFDPNYPFGRRPDAVTPPLLNVDGIGAGPGTMSTGTIGPGHREYTDAQIAERAWADWQQRKQEGQGQVSPDQGPPSLPWNAPQISNNQQTVAPGLPSGWAGGGTYRPASPEMTIWNYITAPFKGIGQLFTDISMLGRAAGDFAATPTRPVEGIPARLGILPGGEVTSATPKVGLGMNDPYSRPDLMSTAPTGIGTPSRGGAMPWESPIGAPPGGATPPAPSGAVPTSIPPGQPFVFDAQTRTYYLGDGRGGMVPQPEASIQAMLNKAAATATGITAQQLWDYMNNVSAKSGIPLQITDFAADVLANIATQAKANPTMTQPGATGVPGGGTTGVSYPAAGSAANTYFQKLAFDVNAHRLSEPDSYTAAKSAGFGGTYNEWLITKDQIIHQSNVNRGGAGGELPGGVSAPVMGNPLAATPGSTAVTEPNVRPFGTGATVLFDQTDLKSIPDAYRSLISRMMSQLGYISTGFMGAFGETEYQRPINPTALTDDLLNQVSTDPVAQAWLRWLAYRKGIYGSVSSYPITPQ